MIFYTSDLHFCDEKILKVCKRPYDSVDTMNHALTNNWNSRIGEMDTTYILGDIFPCAGFEAKTIFDLIKNLHGKKVLIAGNHDEDYLQELEQSGLFENITRIAFVTDSGKEIVLCHYPLMSWRNDEAGSVHLYGHLHNKNLPEVQKYYKDKNAYNVGLDVRNFTPLTLSEILGGKK